MSSPISGLSSQYLQSILSTTLRSAGVNVTGTTSTTNPTLQKDGQQLSPFAQMLSSLQQLQQSDPSKYAQVTSQISTNLQAAAQTAQSQGNTAAATQLNQLATDFSSASKSGQMPNIQDLAQAAGGHHHHGHHSHGSSGDSSSSQLSQLLSALQSSSSTTTPGDSLDPLSIIDSTMQSAGVGTSGS
jgi:hypothetical protein